MKKLITIGLTVIGTIIGLILLAVGGAVSVVNDVTESELFGVVEVQVMVKTSPNPPQVYMQTIIKTSPNTQMYLVRDNGETLEISQLSVEIKDFDEETMDMVVVTNPSGEVRQLSVAEAKEFNKIRIIKEDGKIIEDSF